MDIQYKDSNEFIVEISQNDSTRRIEFFEEEVDAYDSKSSIVIEENRLTKLLFKCTDNNARLYMDGIETLQNDIVKEDINGEVYIEPNSEKIELYNTNNFPLIPGSFRIIVNVNRKSYFSKIEVKPKFITEEELGTIKEDLEEEINGLAFELIKKNLAAGEVIINDLPIKLYKFFIIKSKYSSIMAALEDIKIKPNYRIKKIYKVVRDDEAKSIDEVTIKKYLEGNIEEGFIKQPTIILDYDLPENQWIKKIIQEVAMFLEEFIVSSKQFIDKKNATIEYLTKYIRYESNKNRINDEERSVKYLNQLVELASKMKNSIRMLNSVEWFKGVSYKLGGYLPHTLFCDSRYNLMYKLHQQLKNNDFTVTLDNKFAFQWKRTDKLYEMWCFIKISRIIIGEKLGFTVKGGWLFDQNVSGNNVLIPELESGAKLIFQKGEIYLNLIYDKIMPINSNETSVENMPLYITTRNRQPDGRIDIYKSHVYIGSIILEFKYRDRRYLWDKNYTYYQEGTHVIKQLTSYGDNCSSRYLFKKEEDKISKYKNSIRPVMKVLIFYPKRTDTSQEIDEIEDHNLKFIRFTPRIIKNAEESIPVAIQELIDRSEEYGVK